MSDFKSGNLVRYGGRIFEIKYCDIVSKHKKKTMFLRLFDMLRHKVMECQVVESQCSEFSSVDSFEKILVEYESEDDVSALAFFSDSRYNRYEVPMKLIERIDFSHRVPGRAMVLYVEDKICLSVSTVV